MKLFKSIYYLTRLIYPTQKQTSIELSMKIKRIDPANIEEYRMRYFYVRVQIGKVYKARGLGKVFLIQPRYSQLKFTRLR